MGESCICAQSMTVTLLDTADTLTPITIFRRRNGHFMTGKSGHAQPC